jgi:hypothetical protein
MTDSETFVAAGVAPLTEEQIAKVLKSAESLLRRVPGTKEVHLDGVVFRETGAVMHFECTPEGFVFNFSNTISPVST